MLLCLSNIGDVMATSFRYADFNKKLISILFHLNKNIILDLSIGEFVVIFALVNHIVDAIDEEVNVP